jgi:hypothetical protein
VDGDLRFTDYKTGRPISDRIQASTRNRNLITAIEQGRHLQAVVYALAGEGGTGRFLFLRSDLEPDAAAYTVRADDAKFVGAFESALGTVLGAWNQGAFPPRLLEKKLQKENPDCERCELAAACLRGDSGARRRLAKWLETAETDALGSAERALLDVWRLHEKKSPRARRGQA